MPVDVSPSALPDSRPLHRLLARTRRLLRITWVTTGLGLTLGLLLGTVALAAATDLVLPLESLFGSFALRLDPILRTMALLLIVVPASLAFVQGVVRPLLRRLTPTRVARRIEATMPGIHNRLVSAIDLEGRASAGKASPTFLRKLITEALDRIKNFRITRVLDLVSLRRAALLTAVATCLFAGAWGLFSDRMPTALARIFRPFADIPPAGRVAYNVEPGEAEKLREEPIAFTARVTRGEPSALRLELYGEGKTHKYEMQPDRDDPTLWKFTVDGATLGAGFEKSFRYRVFGGGTWSKRHGVQLLERPEFDVAQTNVYFPAYMTVPGAHPVPAQAVEVSGPEGGEVELVLQPRNQVSEGEIQWLVPTTRPIPLDRQQERVWVDEKLPVGAAPGGTWDWQAAGKRSAHTEPAAVGPHGHWFQGDPVGHTISKGDILFAHLKLEPGQVPETIMLEWHDGENWEHRAFWGADLLREGRLNTPSRHRAGNLPQTGSWVRLEVPAAKVGLEGKKLHGLAFKLHGGQALWGRTGTVQLEEPALRVVKEFALKQREDGAWHGRFPLVGSGLFRPEMRNRGKHPNKPVAERKFVALEDKPPYVSLEGQSIELVMSKARPVPLTVSAFDDYGVAEISVLVREGEGGDYRRRTLKVLPRPDRNVNLVASLTEAAELKAGEVLRYKVEARDRKPIKDKTGKVVRVGQVAHTAEYVVRIADDPNAADKQLDAFDKSQDTFSDRLVKLMGEQKKIRDQIVKAEREQAPFIEKLKDRAEETVPTPPKGKEEKPGKFPEVPTPKLSPEEQKRLAELQKLLASLGKEEAKNAETAKKISDDLNTAAEQAGKLELLPKPLVAQMKGTQSAFDKMVAKAMRDLGKRLDDGGDPKKALPDLKDAKDRADRIDKELKGVKDRLDALANARKGLRDDLQKALAALRDKMLKEDGKMTARELEELRDYIAALRKHLADMKGKQEAAKSDGENAPKGAKGKQEDLEARMKKMLADAKRLLKSEKRRKTDRPEFPDSPFDPEGKEVKVPPKEEDSDEPLPTRKKDKKGTEKGGKTEDKTAKKKDDGEDEEEPKFMPRLGGERPKLDPRYAKKKRPSPKKGGKTEKGEEDKEGDGQQEKLRDLDAAEKSLASDQETLDKMLANLDKSMTPTPGKSGKEGDEGESDPLGDLKSMLGSPSLRQAMAMAAMAKALKNQPGPPMPGKGQPGKGPPTPTPAPPSSVDDAEEGGGADANQPVTADLAKLDPAARAIVLKMPPSRERDELIRGLAERGPGAYEAFSKDYFARLAKTRTKKN